MKALYDGDARAMGDVVVRPRAQTGAGADFETCPMIPRSDGDDRLIAVEVLYAGDLRAPQIVDALVGLDLDVPAVLASRRAGLVAPDREVGPAIAA